MVMTTMKDYAPSAPISTGTFPRSKQHFKREVSKVEEGHLGEFDYTEVFPSAPPLELMDHVLGYDNISFDAVNVPPPLKESSVENHEDISIWENGTGAGEDPNQKPRLSEAQARAKLLEFAQSNCCYGRSAARNMAITKLDYSSAYHYELQTFTEKRETAWTFHPYTGGPIDSAESGTAPLPWDIDIRPTKLFQNEVKAVPVPHTSSIKPCHRCKGTGTTLCHECHGKGWMRCLSCHGDGIIPDSSGYKERCFYCRSSSHGKGRQDCLKCNTKGKINCTSCDGTACILCYIQLTVTWKVNEAEHIVSRTELPQSLISSVYGHVVYEEQGPSVEAITIFPDKTINMASSQLVHQHAQMFYEQRMIAQRHQIRVVPVTKVHYNWENKEGYFFVYGFEEKVFASDYPQTCCWGCSIS